MKLYQQREEAFRKAAEKVREAFEELEGVAPDEASELDWICEELEKGMRSARSAGNFASDGEEDEEAGDF